MPPSAHFFVGPSSVSTPVTQYTNQHDPNISTLDHDDEQPNPPTHSGLEIHLDSDLVILRAGAANPETELQEDDPSRNTCPSSYLDGTVILTLSEPTQISDVILKLQVICRSDYIDALNCKRYRSDYVVLTHNLNLFNNNNSNSNININNASSAPSDYFDQQHPSSSSSNKNPNRLSAGVYRFKFSIELNSDLPPSLITFSRSGAIFYKLRALTASHSSQSKTFSTPTTPTGGYQSANITSSLSSNNLPRNLSSNSIGILPSTSLPPSRSQSNNVSPNQSSSNLTSLKSLQKISHTSLNSLLKPINWLANYRHLESPKVYPKILKTFDSLFSNSFTQSLEIENVWPEKLSYEIGLPRKSFSAGETIPITVKFRPLVKGVKVKTLVATIRESVTLLGKPGGIPHAEMRDAAEFKFEFGPQAGNRNELINQSSDLPTGTSTGPLNPRGEMLETASDLSNLTRKLEEVSNLRDSTKSDCPKGLANSNAQEGSEFDENLSGEIEEVLGIDLPVTTTPSHPQPPIIVHHKLKFSVIIHNPDGHKSELRCALPLNVLPHELAQEVRLASSGTIQGRIHYNPSGSVLDHPLNRFEENILPSYPEHIFDRLPSITRLGDLVHHASPSAFYVPAPWSHITSSPSTPSADFQSPPGLFPPHSQYHHLIPQSTCSTPSASTRRSSCSTGYFTNPNQFQPSQLPSPQQQQSSSTSEPESSLSAGNDNHGRGRSSVNSSRCSSRRTSPNSHAISGAAQSSNHSLLGGSGSSSAFKKSQIRLPKALTKMKSFHQRTPSVPEQTSISSALGLSVSSQPSLQLLPTSQPIEMPRQLTQNREPLHSLEQQTRTENSANREQGYDFRAGELLESEEALSRVPSYELANQELQAVIKSIVPISSFAGLPEYNEDEK